MKAVRVLLADQVHRELKSKAALQGKTLKAYVASELEKIAQKRN